MVKWDFPQNLGFNIHHTSHSQAVSKIKESMQTKKASQKRNAKHYPAIPIWGWTSYQATSRKIVTSFWVLWIPMDFCWSLGSECWTLGWYFLVEVTYSFFNLPTGFSSYKMRPLREIGGGECFNVFNLGRLWMIPMSFLFLFRFSWNIWQGHVMLYCRFLCGSSPKCWRFTTVVDTEPVIAIHCIISDALEKSSSPVFRNRRFQSTEQIQNSWEQLLQLILMKLGLKVSLLFFSWIFLFQLHPGNLT